MTKKQIAALKRIVKREPNLIKKSVSPGVHPAGDGYIVTDGRVAVCLREKPDGFVEGDRLDNVYETIKNSQENEDHFFSLGATSDVISKLKQLGNYWDGDYPNQTGAHAFTVEAKQEDGTVVRGFYNPIYLLDVVEAVGNDSMIYIGNKNLLVYPSDWMAHGYDVLGFVLPRMRES